MILPDAGCVSQDGRGSEERDGIVGAAGRASRRGCCRDCRPCICLDYVVKSRLVWFGLVYRNTDIARVAQHAMSGARTAVFRRLQN